MIRLILVRHGNTFEAGQVPVQVGARTDLPLTAEGRRQAEQMAKYLAGTGTMIYAGNLKRQTEFAQILGTFQLEPALTEIDYGLWEGLTAEEIRLKWPKEYAEWNEAGKWPNGIFVGSWQGHKSTVEVWLERLKKTHQPGATVIGITSNGLLRFFHKEKVKTGHFCELDLFPDRFEIKSWNQKP